MTKITQKEVKKIARLSHIDIHEDEIDSLVKQLEAVLSYAERVTQVASDAEEPSTKNINVFREDVVVKTDPEPILAQAPEREGNFFVVPKILESIE